MKLEINAFGHKSMQNLNADTLEEAINLHRVFGIDSVGTGVALILQPYDVL